MLIKQLENFNVRINYCKLFRTGATEIRNSSLAVDGGHKQKRS